MIQAYPNSKEGSNVLSTLAKIALDSLQFARGASYLEGAARRKSGSAKAALFKAAGQIRARLGDRRRAERRSTYFSAAPGSAGEKATLATAVAKLQIEAGDWAAVVGLLQRASSAGASSAQMNYMLGYALFRRDQLSSAQGYLASAVQAGKSAGGAGREAAAAAQFYLGEIAFKAFEQIQLSSDLSQLGTTLQQKLGFMAQTRAAYTAVGGFGSGIWTVRRPGTAGVGR